MRLTGGVFKQVVFERFRGSVLGKLVREKRTTAKENVANW